MGFISRLFGSREPTSRDIARERLQLVLVQDRVKISPTLLEQMKDELITVISRYVEIDADGVEVILTQGRRETRLVANIPVAGPVRRTSSGRARAGAGAGGHG
jgi:cell division topological specificity factor